MAREAPVDVKVLVEMCGQDVNEIDDGGKTPVYHAAYNDKKGVVSVF